MTLQLEYADRILGVMVQSLRNWGIYDKAVMAVVADHGAAFIPGQSRRLLRTANSGWILRVPMLVKLPHQRRGRIISRPVRTIDLLPTIADVLGIRLPWRVDGRSLFGVPSRASLNTYVRHGQEVAHMPPAAIRRSFRTAIAVRNGLLGSGDVYTLGASGVPCAGSCAVPAGRVLGREPRGDRLRPGGCRCTLTPCYGSIVTPGVSDGQSLIAKLNGRIVAVGQSVDGGTRFTLLIPPSAFRPGENRLQLFAP